MGSEAHTELHVSSGTGLIPRFMNDLFERLQASQGGGDNPVRFALQASFLEVYGEDVYDLLVPDRPSLPLREDASGGVVCAGLTHRAVATAQEALEVLHEGTLHRTTAATLMNLTSSRSHAVFSITLTMTTATQQSTTSTAAGDNPATSGGGSSSTTSRFTFVDLAGSERMKKTGAEGERAREGIKINEGLLALGNVINALADEERLQHNHNNENGKSGGNNKSGAAGLRKVHVPYRQSKLTRLLQDALGGNSQTLFLACVSPSDTNASETLSTLHYANRARNIRNAPTKNVDANVLELRRLHSLVAVLERALVKTKFGGEEADDESSSPTTDEIQYETLLRRPDVLEFLSVLHAKASEQQQQASTNMTSAFRKPLAIKAGSIGGPPPSPLRLGITPIPEQGTPNGSNHNKSVMENFDPALLGEVNPDEEMAILDQLLELQHRDNEFDEEQKKDDAELKQVEGELAKQENMLLQLRDSLKVYHDMKGKYEALMAEVQQLEVEKVQLAEQLEKVTADPSKGCSKAIKKELAKVEQSLARARNETRKHREMYRKAEQEAKKCAVLERKISDLKAGKVKLIKKQKESAARHREYTESKTREIMALKRTNRNNEQRMSKLQTEVQRQKKNLDKRHEYCSKLTAKLKQTEAHLMKLLSLRQRELHRDFRASSIPHNRSSTFRRRTSVFGGVPVNARQQLSHESAFAPPSQALSSVQYLLNEVVAERVDAAEVRSRYEERVAGYGEAMRQLVDAVKALEQARVGNGNHDGDDQDGSDSNVVRDLEQTVEDLELKVELVGEELESLRIELATAENAERREPIGEVDDDRVKVLIHDKDAPTLRSLLLETTQRLVQVQVRASILSVLFLQDRKLTRSPSFVAYLSAAPKSTGKSCTTKRVRSTGS